MSEEGARFAFETFSVDFKHKLKLSLVPSSLFGSGAIFNLPLQTFILSFSVNFILFPFLQAEPFCLLSFVFCFFGFSAGVLQPRQQQMFANESRFV